MAQNKMKYMLLKLLEAREVINKASKYNFQVDLEASHAVTERVQRYEQFTPSGTYLTGIISTARIAAFERMIWRITRGNMLHRFENISILLEDPETGENVRKSFFLIFVHGQELQSRIQKICDGFHAQIYPCPRIDSEREELQQSIAERIVDLRVVIRHTGNHKKHMLDFVAKSVNVWKIENLKAKAIYYTMNKMDVDVAGDCYVGQCWIPDYELVRVKECLQDTTTRLKSKFWPILNLMIPDEEPPTHYRKNKFLAGFQSLVDAYGVPSYKEINPAPFAIITFPFLFAVMFGDIGHGIIVALFAIWMILKEKPLAKADGSNEMWRIMFAGRYIIFLMGLFSIYTGFIYNDMFSKPLNLFGSRWKIDYNVSTVSENDVLQLNPNSKMYDGEPYPFGVDPMWPLAASNKIIFTNAFKMKLSIIFGVLQMLFGICLSCFNSIFFSHYLTVFCEFIPQIIFMCCIFVYLVFLMFYKWIMYEPNDSACAPSILITFINMLMFKKMEKADDSDCSPEFFDNQEAIQRILVMIALSCVPWLLFLKPFYLYINQKPKNPRDYSQEQSVNNEEDSLSEIMIHQGIHTIEYVLGSVSHTASYLRLWALSLAHSQLAEVLWMMVMNIGIRNKGIFGGMVLTITFGIWACGTIAILVVMEGLSAFLHTLRLHWVEFQSKFYIGQGVTFVPFSFEKMLKKERNIDIK